MWHGKLFESRDAMMGDRFLECAPGVYTFNDYRTAKAFGYPWWAPLLGCGWYWAVVWEALVDDRDRFKFNRTTDQQAHKGRGGAPGGPTGVVV